MSTEFHPFSVKTVAVSFYPLIPRIMNMRNYLFDEFRSAEQSDGSKAESNESEKTASRLRFGLLSKYGVIRTNIFFNRKCNFLNISLFERCLFCFREAISQ